MKILILNGPNLNLTGLREPEVYGTTTLQQIIDSVRGRFPEVEIHHRQSNHEGALIDAIHEYGFMSDCGGIVLNAGGYSHTSVALADAVRAVPAPVIEVHMSNVAAREPFRHTSLLSAACRGTITGLGTAVYTLAVAALTDEII